MPEKNTPSQVGPLGAWSTGVSDAVTVDLEDLDAMDGWILESRIDCEGGAEVTPLLVELLMDSILCISRSYRFLRSVEIVQ